MIKGCLRLISVLSKRAVSTTSTATGIPTFNVAIVGSGPAGFYTAHQLLGKALPRDKFIVNVDFFEKNPVPYGLSRYGVAPDHPEVKNCEEYLDNLMAASSEADLEPRVRFFGNVVVGKDITPQQLGEKYHSVVLAYGCTNSDNKLNIKGSDLNNVIFAREFVSWYNSHPDFHGKTSFVPPQLNQIENVTIIGNGNVALDVARVLLADPNDHWKNTDLSIAALEALKQSTVKQVNIVARRGILESAFSNKEIRELFEISNMENSKINFIPVDDSIMDEIKPIIKSLGRVDKRKVQIIQKYSNLSKDFKTSSRPRSWALRYLLSPTEMIGDNDGNVVETKFAVNKLVKNESTGVTQVSPTNVTETIKNDLVILSIGYQGTPIEGFTDLNVSFKRNKLVNEYGRIINETTNEVLPGWYTSGWIKNGPQGVIATTMIDSFDTGNSILEDLSLNITTQGDIKFKTGIENDDLPKDLIISTWNGWLKIHEEEKRLGSQLGRKSTKLETRDEMLEIASK